MSKCGKFKEYNCIDEDEQDNGCWACMVANVFNEDDIKQYHSAALQPLPTPPLSIDRLRELREFVEDGLIELQKRLPVLIDESVRRDLQRLIEQEIEKQEGRL